MRTELTEHGLWTCHTTVEKFDHDPSDLGLTQDDWDRFVLNHEIEPYEVRDVEGNILVTAGITALLNLLIAAGGTAFNNANAYLGVGDSATAAAIGNTDLIGAGKVRAAMVATYPQVSTNTVTFRSDFTGAVANITWAEWGTFNASTAGTMLNRKVEALGTKASGTWTLTVTITIT
jgi:hypothetical protein